MRAGHSFVGALSVADQDAPQPVRREFDRAIADERLGVPAEPEHAPVAEILERSRLDDHVAGHALPLEGLLELRRRVDHRAHDEPPNPGRPCVLYPDAFKDGDT